MGNPEGFSKINNGKANAAALQKAVDAGGCTVIDEPGEYRLADTVLLGSDTTLIFGKDVVVIREPCEIFNGNAFINKGAFSGTADKNITLKVLIWL